MIVFNNSQLMAAKGYGFYPIPYNEPFEGRYGITISVRKKRVTQDKGNKNHLVPFHNVKSIMWKNIAKEQLRNFKKSDVRFSDVIY